MIGGIFKIFLSVLICNWIYDEVKVFAPSLTDLSDKLVESARIPTHHDLGLDSATTGNGVLASLQSGINSAESEMGAALGFSSANQRYSNGLSRQSGRDSFQGFREFAFVRTRANYGRAYQLERF